MIINHLSCRDDMAERNIIFWSYQIVDRFSTKICTVEIRLIHYNTHYIAMYVIQAICYYRSHNNKYNSTNIK